MRTLSVSLLILGCVLLGFTAANPEPEGFLSRLLGRGGGGGWEEPKGWGPPIKHVLVHELPTGWGEKTHAVLPDLVKEYHHHEVIKKPHFKVQTTKSESHKNQKVLHEHLKTQKVVHKQHHHEHVLKQHHQHNVHHHNVHTNIHHVHENILKQEHIHIPIKHEPKVQHEHKVTEEHKSKTLLKENHHHEHAKEEKVTHHEAAPIYQPKEWSIGGWLNAWGK